VGEDEIRVAESRLDLPRLVAMGCEGAQVETFEFPPALVDTAPPHAGGQ
jgi:hypothetical protein